MRRQEAARQLEVLTPEPRCKLALLWSLLSPSSFPLPWSSLESLPHVWVMSVGLPSLGLCEGWDKDEGPEGS